MQRICQKFMRRTGGSSSMTFESYRTSDLQPPGFDSSTTLSLDGLKTGRQCREIWMTTPKIEAGMLCGRGTNLN